MAIWSEFRMAEYRADNHGEDAPHFIRTINIRFHIRWPMFFFLSHTVTVEKKNIGQRMWNLMFMVLIK
jgi:hypothetical protein